MNRMLRWIIVVLTLQTLSTVGCESGPVESGTDVADDGAVREIVARDSMGLAPPDVIPELEEDAPPPPWLDTSLLSGALEMGDSDSIDTLMSLYDGPACDEETCIIVTWAPDHEAVFIRGEFNDWEKGPMEASPLEGWFWTQIPVAVLDGCKDYKLFADGVWFRDPMNRWIGFADYEINSALCPREVSRIALVEGVYSPQLNNARSLYVYVPAAAFLLDVQAPQATFPVLYMQDGFNVFTNPMAAFGSWNVDATADALIAAGEVEPLIIVGVDTHDRMNEYLYTDITVDLGRGPTEITPLLPDYAEFLVKAVKPLIDETFPTRPGRLDTGMAGSSLGGISSLWIAWHRADVFGRVASFSGSYWIGQEGSGTEGHSTMEAVLQEVPPNPDQLALRIYLDSGTGSLGQDDHPYTGDARCYTDWTRNVLISLGWDNRAEWDDDGDLETPPADFPVTADPADVPTLYWSPTVPEGFAGWDDYLRPAQNLLHLVGDGHAHDEAAWEQRFSAMLRFLFPAG